MPKRVQRTGPDKAMMVMLPEALYRRMKLAAASRNEYIRAFLERAITKEVDATPGVSHIDDLANTDVPQTA